MDPRKIYGKKLIERMLEIEKYQKMQTAMASQIFEAES